MGLGHPSIFFAFSVPLTFSSSSSSFSSLSLSLSLSLSEVGLFRVQGDKGDELRDPSLRLQEGLILQDSVCCNGTGMLLSTLEWAGLQTQKLHSFTGSHCRFERIQETGS